jgi:hypothetical protein
MFIPRRRLPALRPRRCARRGAKHKVIRTKWLRFLISGPEKQVIAGRQRRTGDDFRHQLDSNADEANLLICSRREGHSSGTPSRRGLPGAGAGGLAAASVLSE